MEQSTEHRILVALMAATHSWRAVLEWARAQSDTPRFSVLAASLLEPDADEVLTLFMARDAATLRKLVADQGVEAQEHGEVSRFSYGVAISHLGTALALAVAARETTAGAIVALEAGSNVEAHVAVAREVANRPLNVGATIVLNGRAAHAHLESEAPELASRWLIKPGGALAPWLNNASVFAAVPAGGKLAFAHRVWLFENNVHGITNSVQVERSLGIPLRSQQRSLAALRSLVASLEGDGFDPKLEPFHSEAGSRCFEALKAHRDDAQVMAAMSWV